MKYINLILIFLTKLINLTNQKSDGNGLQIGPGLRVFEKTKN